MDGGLVFSLSIIAGLVGSLLVVPVGGPVRVASEPVEPLVVAVSFPQGAGCPDAAPTPPAAVVAPDNLSVTVTFGPEFRAATGPGSAATDFRKNCQFYLTLASPAGYTPLIVGARHSGRLSVPAGLSATHRWTIYRAGMSQSPSVVNQLPGPADDAWHVDNPIDPFVRMQCGTPSTFAFGGEVRVQPNVATAAFAGVESSTYLLSWQTC
jgi:hypothetical protein